MPAVEAAKKILEGVRRNYEEFSVPGYLLYLGHILRYINFEIFIKITFRTEKKLIITNNILFLSFLH